MTRVRAGLQALDAGIPEGWPDYVLHQMVTVLSNGEEVKISKRAGSYVTLRDLIDEVGCDATRYFLVARHPDSQLVFDIDLAKSQSNDNPVYYIQYAHARICSRDRKLGERGLGLRSQPRANKHRPRLEGAPHEQLAHPRGFRDSRKWSNRPAAEAAPCRSIPHYLREVADAFHSYYNAEQFLVDDAGLRNARMALVYGHPAGAGPTGFTLVGRECTGEDVMSRDYSSRRNSPPAKGKKRPPPRRRAAAKPAPQKRSRSSGPPGWIWLLCGLCIGLTVAAGFYVFGRPAGTPAREQISIATPDRTAGDASGGSESGAPAEATAPARKEEEPRFSFYKMLPNYEVVIPEEEYPDKSASASHGGSHGSTPVGEPPKATPSKPEPTTPKVDEPGNYVIQAGSFSTFEDADRRKAELALLGVTAQIVDVDLASGKTVYRVQSNTISSSDKLNNMLKRPRENRIDTLVMRAKN